MRREAWERELNSFVRAFSGAYIFGIPLLFAMEMWWIGEYIDAWRLLVLVALALLTNLGLNHFAGFKKTSTFRTSINQTVDAVAVGIVAGAVMLAILNQIGTGDPPHIVIHKIVIQAVPLSLGASVANQVFGTHRDRNREEGNDESGVTPRQGLLLDAGATIIGGVFIGFSITPTEEVPMIAAMLEYWHMVAIIIFSLLISYGIVFASGFDTPSPPGPFQHPLTETAFAYLLSLIVSFLTLYLFKQISLGDPLLHMVELTLVLALPTTVGGAAGRLVI